MRPIFSLCFVALFISGVFSQATAQEEVAAFSEITRHDQITLGNDMSVLYRKHHVLIIKNANGLDHAAYSFHQNSRNKLLAFDATVTDLITGKVVKKYKLKDLGERSLISDISLYQDDREKFFDARNFPIPCKIEIIAEHSSLDNFFINSWDPQEYWNQKVVKAEVVASYPPSVGLRFREMNFEKGPAKEVSEGSIQLKWVFEQMEPKAPNPGEDYPWVQFAPARFSLDGISSDMRTWEGFGKFYAQLIAGKDELPKQFKAEVHKMVEGATDDYEKVSRLYSYLQKNFRYLVIFLGIDGWEPRKAEDVLETKYGECKGLSTLMKGMLREVGINAQYALVFADDKKKRPLAPDFPVHSFNHAFLRVPIGDDVIWLECTNDFLPAGFSGDFTSDRDVFVITGDGGFLDRTPKYAEAKFHQVKNNYSLELQPNGDAKFSGSNTYGGFPAIPFWALERYADENTKKSYLNSQAAGSGAIVANFSMQNIPNREVPRTTIDYSGIVQRFAQQTAKRVILPTHWKKMDADFLGEGNLNWEESLEITLLPNLSLESGIGEFKHQDNLFDYNLSSQLVDNKLIVKSNLIVHCPEPLGKEDKALLVNKINDQFKKTIILKKSEMP